MIVTGKFANGNCTEIRSESDGVVSATVRMNETSLKNGWTNQCPLFLGKIEDARGRGIRLDVRWPEFDRDSMQGAHDYGGNDSFIEAAPHCVFTSTDAVRWARHTSATRADWTVRIPLEIESDQLYIAINLPYTLSDFQRLRETLDASPFVRRELIGASYGACDFHLYEIGEASEVSSEKPAVYIQALQHPSEVSGPRVLDSMLRYLIGHDPEAQRFRRECSLYVVPLIAVDAWLEGLDYHVSGGNLNRDWQSFSMTETRLLRPVIDRIMSLPARPVLALDLHNGWHSMGHHGAAITVMPETSVGKLLPVRQRDFIREVATRTDFIPETAVWEAGYKPHGFAGYMTRTYGIQAHTVEFSRFSIWDRKTSVHAPLSQERLERLGKQLVPVLTDWLTGPGKQPPDLPEVLGNE